MADSRDIKDLHERLDVSLTNQAPDPRLLPRIEHLRSLGKGLGAAVIDLVPGSREQSLALTHLEETIMWAVKGLVLNQGAAGAAEVGEDRA